MARPTHAVSVLPSPLCVITDRGAADRPLPHLVRDAVSGGARWIRVREPDLDLWGYCELCRLLLESAAHPDVTWSVRPAAWVLLRSLFPARRLAVHLRGGEVWGAAADDAPHALDASAARHVRYASHRSTSVLVGRSVHVWETNSNPGSDATDPVSGSAETVPAARYWNADYLLLAPIFATTSKPDATPVGLAALRAFTEAAGLPVVALGGITPARVAECRDAGAKAVAVRGAVMRAADTEGCVRELLAEWQRAERSPAAGTPAAGTPKEGTGTVQAWPARPAHTRMDPGR